MTEEQLSALLRLKRYEQPQPGYFNRLLRDIQHRQRAELLRRSLWQIASERIQTFFSEHSMGGLSFGGAMASALLLGLATIAFLTPGEVKRTSTPSTVASVGTSSPDRMLSLQTQTGTPAATLESQPFPTAPSGRDESRFPRYIIDARPASYEPSFQF